MVILPSLQNIFNFIPSQMLNGVEYEAVFPELSFKAWKEGSFQKDFENWYNRKYGLRDYLVRTENQLNYFLFNQLNQDILLGNKNNLLTRSYVIDYLGFRKIAKDTFITFADNLKKMQDYLEKRGIKFILIIAPSKASVCPEYIPDYYMKYKNKYNSIKTNYEKLVPLLDKYGVNYLDGHKFCVNLKTRTTYPVFPKGGIHWSHYAGFLFSQEIVNRMRAMVNRNINTVKLSNIKLLKDPFDTDADIAKLTNLWDIDPFIEPSVYPEAEKVIFRDSYKPNILFIGDSFMYTPLYWLNKFELIDSRSEFYYYFKNKKILDEKKELLSRDFVIIEANEEMLSSTGFGFIEAVLEKSDLQYVQDIKALCDTIKIRKGSSIKLPFIIRNKSKVRWEGGNYAQGVRLSYHVLDPMGKIVVYDGERTLLPHDLAPGEEVSLQAQIKAPESSGRFIYRFTMLKELVSWFDARGAKTLDIPVTVTE